MGGLDKIYTFLGQYGENQRVQERNMKAKNVKINKCVVCKEKVGNFIWTTSRNVNKGIKAMYPNEKLCLSCYKSMLAVYPEKTNSGYERCICGGRIVTAKKGIPLYLEHYCEKCGLVRERYHD